MGVNSKKGSQYVSKSTSCWRILFGLLISSGSRTLEIRSRILLLLMNRAWSVNLFGGDVTLII